MLPRHELSSAPNCRSVSALPIGIDTASLGRVLDRVLEVHARSRNPWASSRPAGSHSLVKARPISLVPPTVGGEMGESGVLVRLVARKNQPGSPFAAGLERRSRAGALLLVATRM